MDLDEREVFRRRVTNARLWRESAEHLLAAADTLWGEIGPVFDAQLMTGSAERSALTHFRPYYLIAGLSVESFLKALRVRQLYPRSGELAWEVMTAPEPQLPRELLTHKLVDLAKNVEIGRLTPSEANLLERLTVFIRWAGRYPVDTRPSGPAANFVSKDDHQAIHRFIGRVRVAYDALPRQPMRLNERT